MPKCEIKGCQNYTQYVKTKEKYCPMHLERIRRHGYPELKKEKGEHALETLPHQVVDDFIVQNCQHLLDKEIVIQLKKLGIKKVNIWNVKYRRRKLGIKKYLYGEVKKHKAWIRAQAIKKYGNRCELCSYPLSIDTHHVIPKYKGGRHEIDNLMVICPNCHALITRGIVKISNRRAIPQIRRIIRKKMQAIYNN